MLMPGEFMARSAATQAQAQKIQPTGENAVRVVSIFCSFLRWQTHHWLEFGLSLHPAHSMLAAIYEGQ